MKHLKVFEEYSKYPQVYRGQEYINNEDGEIYVATDDFMSKVFYYKKNKPNETLHMPGVIFHRNFTKVEPPIPPAPKKDMYMNYDNEVEMDFNNSVYLSDEKAVIGAYLITKDGEKYIEVMNIKEFESKDQVFIDNAPAYSVTIHKEKLPKSQIEIISEVTDREGFFYIKIPYWLYKEKPNLTIKRCKLNFNKKRLSLPDRILKNKELMKWFQDPDVEKYFKSSDSDARTQQLVQLYKKRKI